MNLAFISIILAILYVSDARVLRDKRAPETNANWRDYAKNKIQKYKTSSDSSSTSYTTTTTTTSTTTTTTTTSILIDTTTIPILSIISETNTEQIPIIEEISSQNISSDNYTILNPSNVFNPKEINDPRVVLENEDLNVTSVPPILETITPSHVARFFDAFDRYTLILTSAFVCGFLLIGCIIFIAYCICKGCNKLRRKKPTKESTTNPIYDDKLPHSFDTLINPTPVVHPDHTNSGTPGSQKKSKIYKIDETNDNKIGGNKEEEEKLIDYGDSAFNTPKNERGQSIKSPNTIPSVKSLSSTSSLSSQSSQSSSSINSIIKSPPSVQTNTIKPKPSQPSTPISSIPLKSSHQSLTKVEKNIELIELRNSTDKNNNNNKQNNSGSSNNIIASKPPTPRSSIRNNSNRTNSVSIDDDFEFKLSKRISTTSIPAQKIDFDKIMNDVDKLVDDKSNINHTNITASVSSLAKIKPITNINASSLSINNSTSDIYMKAIHEKREAEKSKLKNNQSGKNDYTPIQNISFDPSGNASRSPAIKKTNLSSNNLDRYSINTLDSEKSSY